MPEFDTLIRGGNLVDGTGRPSRVADVAMSQGRVAAVGRIPPHAAKRVIDADGLVVAPGFIDLHTHYDAQVHWDPYCTNSGWHGVTSVTVGNCGFGLAPVRADEIDRALLTLSRNEAIPLAAMKAALPFTWETFPQFLDHLETLPLGINLSHLAPISPMVAYAAGSYDDAKERGLSGAERERLLRLLAEALTAGAVGWGAQRQLPGTFASFQRDFDGSPMISDLLPGDLYLDLAAVLRGRDGAFIQFAQSTATPGDMIEATRRDFDFNAELSKVSGGPVLYNAVAAVDRGPEVFRTQLAWIDAANREGLSVFGQGVTARARLVMTFEDWNLFDSSPIWCEATLGTLEQRMVELADPAVRRAMREEYESNPGAISFFGNVADYELHRTGRGDLERFVGRTLRELARASDAHVIDAMLDVSLSEGLTTEWMTPLSNGNATKTKALFDSPHVIPGTSDGGAHVKFQTTGDYGTDLLSWLVRDAGVLSLEEAHYRLSALPARIAGFRDRGTLEPGKAADVVIYDLARLAILPVEKVYDLPAGEWRRTSRAEGYRHILVNGEETFTDGRCTGLTPGRLLRRGGAS